MWHNPCVRSCHRLELTTLGYSVLIQGYRVLGRVAIIGYHGMVIGNPLYYNGGSRNFKFGSTRFYTITYMARTMILTNNFTTDRDLLCPQKKNKGTRIPGSYLLCELTLAPPNVLINDRTNWRRHSFKSKFSVFSLYHFELGHW